GQTGVRPGSDGGQTGVRQGSDRGQTTFAGVSPRWEPFLEDGPVHHPRYQLLAQDLRRLHAFRTADPAAIRGLLNRVAAHFLTKDGKLRAGDRIHPYKNDDYPSTDARKRHCAEANRLAPGVDRLLPAHPPALDP